MDEVYEYLTTVPAWYLATIDEQDGEQPRVRPFSFVALDDNKLWFSTSIDKDVYRELTAHPKFEVSAWQPGSPWIVITGQSDFSEEPSERVYQEGFKHMLNIGEYHKSPHDGRLIYFSVKQASASIRDIDGSQRTIALTHSPA